MEHLSQVGPMGPVEGLDVDKLKSKLAEISVIARMQTVPVVKLLLNSADFDALCKEHRVLYASSALKVCGIRVEKSDLVLPGQWIEVDARGFMKLHKPKDNDDGKADTLQ